MAIDKINPFKKTADNASSTAKKWNNELSDSSVQSRNCPQCGAPRLVNTNLAYCSYCRYNFMSVDLNITRKYE